MLLSLSNLSCDLKGNCLAFWVQHRHWSNYGDFTQIQLLKTINKVSCSPLHLYFDWSYQNYMFRVSNSKMSQPLHKDLIHHVHTIYATEQHEKTLRFRLWVVIVSSTGFGSRGGNTRSLPCRPFLKQKFTEISHLHNLFNEWIFPPDPKK
jgi:hypothetical protein